jgi:ribonuclease BN (tRNA processing enzyme)
VRLTIVGCSAAWGRGAEAASSCYLVESADAAFVLDLGQGSFARLAALRPPESLTAVVISHGHPDHCVDLIPLRHYLRYEARAAPGTVALHGPAGLPARFDAFIGDAGFLADLPFTALEPGETQIGGLSLRVGRVSHTADSFAFRVGERGVAGAGLVYSGDCGDPAELVPLLRPGDTLLAEASFGAGPVPPGVPHLDAERAARAATDGGARRLIVTHLQADTDASAALNRARETFAGEAVLARPGLRLEL